MWRPHSEGCETESNDAGAVTFDETARAAPEGRFLVRGEDTLFLNGFLCPEVFDGMALEYAAWKACLNGWCDGV